jgi:hypothetical protein
MRLTLARFAKMFRNRDRGPIRVVLGALATAIHKIEIARSGLIRLRLKVGGQLQTRLFPPDLLVQVLG